MCSASENLMVDYSDFTLNTVMIPVKTHQNSMSSLPIISFWSDSMASMAARTVLVLKSAYSLTRFKADHLLWTFFPLLSSEKLLRFEVNYPG